MYQPWWPSHGSVACGSTAAIVAITIVGKRTRKPQKMNACIRPGNEPVEQLLLAEDDRRLVAELPRRVGRAVVRARAAHLRGEEAGAAREQPAAGDEQDGERDRGDGYSARTFLSSALIAGTISCRSPITP